MADQYSKDEVVKLPWPQWVAADDGGRKREWTFTFEQPISIEQAQQIGAFRFGDIAVDAKPLRDPRELSVVQYTSGETNSDDAFYTSAYDLMRFANSLSRLTAICGLAARHWAPFRTMRSK